MFVLAHLLDELLLLEKGSYFCSVCQADKRTVNCTCGMFVQNYNDRTYTCPNCFKRYQHKRTMVAHVRYECGKDPQFACTYCTHRSKTKGNLKSHIKKMHSNNFSKLF